MKKNNDKQTGTANIIIYGDELRKMRAENLARWKRRMARRIDALKYRYDSETTNMEEQVMMARYNNAIDAALKIINAKWKNI